MHLKDTFGLQKLVEINILLYFAKVKFTKVK